MEISKILFDEIMKLNKSEWDKVKVTVDYMFHLERSKIEKTLYLNPSDVKENLPLAPIPIRLQSE